jgi:hypothetical protein
MFSTLKLLWLSHTQVLAYVVTGSQISAYVLIYLWFSIFKFVLLSHYVFDFFGELVLSSQNRSFHSHYRIVMEHNPFPQQHIPHTHTNTFV